MPFYGRFYVLGPPVKEASDVAGLVEYVMRQTADMRAADFNVHAVEGPVRFDSTWISGGRAHEIRRGLGVADLWTGLVRWPNERSAKYFSVIVMDYDYIQRFKKRRHLNPSFETFVVGVQRMHHPGVDAFQISVCNGSP